MHTHTGTISLKRRCESVQYWAGGTGNCWLPNSSNTSWLSLPPPPNLLPILYYFKNKVNKPSWTPFINAPKFTFFPALSLSVLALNTPWLFLTSPSVSPVSSAWGHIYLLNSHPLCVSECPSVLCAYRNSLMAGEVNSPDSSWMSF